MGNYVSCRLSTPLMKRPKPKAARVILPDGEIRQFRPGNVVKAAEVMLECPNFFLTNAKSLHIGKRFSPLGADEELEFGDVYIMFPMKRVNSMVTEANVASLFMAASSTDKRVMNDIGGEASRLMSLEMEGVVDEGVPYRLVSCRSRKPLLETIKEEPVCSSL